MNVIASLSVFALLTTALYGLYWTLLRWLHTPIRVTSKTGMRNHRAPRTTATQVNAAIHAFSR
jgi:hypothetical protein